MSPCAQCGTALESTSQVCPRCGTPTPWAQTTVLEPDETRMPSGTPGTTPSSGQTPTSRTAWISSSDSIDHGRFSPGDVIADRYRIIGRLGKGGMGEVFRADDLRLGQPVALKFLPGALERDAMKLAQFHAEVRFARQVSHPNVCRVYDIGEAEGVPYLSMEYVDGENLSSLLRRIGRLPQDKGLEVARQLCAGLAAMHDRGVLHRDLKPANVMLDGQGNVRLTDFGLASVVGIIDPSRAGTPAFMSPEQLAGREIDVRSDVFALGLVLYEIFTGRRAFDAPSVGELMRAHEASLVTPPRQIVADLDPQIEQTILRCLEYNPAGRPGTALAVAASLPGGDPLAAALAAGETPSPAMVAAAGETAAMPRSRAALCVLGLSALIAATAVLGSFGGVLHHVPSPKAPAVLIDRAESLLASIGYPTDGMSTAWGFEPHRDYLEYLRTDEMRLARKEAHARRPSGFGFFYRTSPRKLVPYDSSKNVRVHDPPLDVSGMTELRLDPQGRLLRFAAVPPQVDQGTPGPAVPWTSFFQAAELDPSKFTEVAPTWTPPTFADTRIAWTGELPDRPGMTLRIEAASYRGRPVSFELVGPWTRPAREQEHESPERRGPMGVFVALAIVVMLAAALLVARMNLRAGRGDRTGATRIAAAMGTSSMLAWLLGTTHFADPMAELGRFFTALGDAAFIALLVWLLYVALEPWVRRFWPDSLKGWTRLVGGHVSDPRVGRDVMIGLAFGLGLHLLVRLSIPVHGMLGHIGPPPLLGNVELLAGPVPTIASLLSLVWAATFNALWSVFLIVGLKVGLKRMPLVVVGTIAFYMIITVPAAIAEGGTPWIGGLLAALSIMTLVTVIVRYGLLASNAAFFGSYLSSAVPWSLSFGEWQAVPAEMAILVLVALAAWAGWTAAGGRTVSRA